MSRNLLPAADQAQQYQVLSQLLNSLSSSGTRNYLVPGPSIGNAAMPTALLTYIPKTNQPPYFIPQINNPTGTVGQQLIGPTGFNPMPSMNYRPNFPAFQPQTSWPVNNFPQMPAFQPQSFTPTTFYQRYPQVAMQPQVSWQQFPAFQPQTIRPQMTYYQQYYPQQPAFQPQTSWPANYYPQQPAFQPQTSWPANYYPQQPAFQPQTFRPSTFFPQQQPAFQPQTFLPNYQVSFGTPYYQRYPVGMSVSGQAPWSYYGGRFATQTGPAFPTGPTFPTQTQATFPSVGMQTQFPSVPFRPTTFYQPQFQMQTFPRLPTQATYYQPAANYFPSMQSVGQQVLPQNFVSRPRYRFVLSVIKCAQKSF